ncbi:MAG: 30S ribosomal protein S11 [Candidatus Shikimatogenerans sp. Tduv]|uniref:Small ribosomal subunit protein uS11 n=1 Tax=Candidatus Shikimatogenerans sp. Tduv TaxID=3158567 RepID=A0AAU7QRR0_9FLAO
MYKKKINYKCNVYIRTTYNNIIITLTDEKGNVLLWSSSGKMKFKGSKKTTPYAAEIICKDLINRSIKLGLKKVNIFVKGISYIKDIIIKTIYNMKIKISIIKDITPISHNGCRPPKKRRI